MRLPSLLALAPLAALVACTAPETAHDVRGVYHGPSSTQGAISIEHEAIPGFMEAMTMDFAVADTAGLGALRPGDKVRFHLAVPESGAARVSHVERLPDTTRLSLAPAMLDAPPADTAAARPSSAPDTAAHADHAAH